MPVISFYAWDLKRLTGLGMEEAVELLRYRVKGDVESVEEGLIRMEVTHDRPDHFSVEGIARTLKGLKRAEVGIPRFEAMDSGITTYVDVIDERPYSFMAVVYDLDLDAAAIEQIIQLQEKLSQTFGRDRRTVAIGYYDLDMLRPPLYYRRVTRDFKYRPIGEEREMAVSEVLDNTEKGQRYGRYIRRDMPPAIFDSEGNILTVVPVLGSEQNKVREGTRNVLIDVTGTDRRLVLNVLNVLVFNLLERSTSRRVGVVKMEYEDGEVTSPVLTNRELEVNPAYASEHLGIPIDEEQLGEALSMARYDYLEGRVTVPPYRFLVLHPVDVIEDVAIVLGYETIPREFPHQFSVGKRNDVEVVSGLFRRALIALGFQEVANYVLASRDVLEEHVLWRRPLVRITNPVSERYAYVRDHIYPQLLTVAAHNMPAAEIKIFEVGDVVRGYGVERVTALLISRDRATLTDGIVALNTLLGYLGLKPAYEPLEVPGLIPERTSAVYLGNSRVGFVGEVQPEVLTNVGLLVPTVVGEISVDAVIGAD